jgi:hypothetical protein
MGLYIRNSAHSWNWLGWFSLQIQRLKLFAAVSIHRVGIVAVFSHCLAFLYVHQRLFHLRKTGSSCKSRRCLKLLDHWLLDVFGLVDHVDHLAFLISYASVKLF